MVTRNWKSAITHLLTLRQSGITRIHFESDMKYFTRILPIVLIMVAVGCRHCGILEKRRSELSCPTDIRQKVPWCAGEDAVFYCPCGPDREFYGCKPTCWSIWPSSGAEWRDAHCGPPIPDHGSQVSGQLQELPQPSESQEARIVEEIQLSDPAITVDEEANPAIPTSEESGIFPKLDDHQQPVIPIIEEPLEEAPAKDNTSDTSSTNAVNILGTQPISQTSFQGFSPGNQFDRAVPLGQQNLISLKFVENTEQTASNGKKKAIRSPAKSRHVRHANSFRGNGQDAQSTAQKIMSALRWQDVKAR